MTRYLEGSLGRLLCAILVAVIGMVATAAMLGAICALKYGVDKDDVGLLCVLSLAAGAPLVAAGALFVAVNAAFSVLAPRQKKHIIQMCAVVFAMAVIVTVVAGRMWLMAS